MIRNSPDIGATETPNRYSVGMTILLFFGILLNIILIAAAARGDLWLDEIWSLSFAEAAKTPWEIFTRFRHDNNHVLNTLFMYFLGHRSSLYSYRILAVLSGIGSIFLLFRIARQRGIFESLFVVLLAGTSYPLVLYFSEARGYAPAMFFSLLSLASLEECQRRFESWKLVIFQIAMISGTLSHLTFVIVMISLLGFSIVREFRSDSPLRQRLMGIGTYFAIPLSFAAAFWLIFARHIKIGGGPVYGKWEEIAKAAALLTGLPESPGFRVVAVVCVFALIVAGICLLYRDKSEQWSFFLLVLPVTPAMLIAFTQPEFFYFRYFVVSFPFFYLLASYVFGRCFHSRNKILRCLVVVLTGAMIVGQTQRLIPLLKLGRGNYMAMLSDIVSESGGGILRIGSDHDFQNKLVIMFYASLMPELRTSPDIERKKWYQGMPDRIRYTDQKNWKQETPEWIITQSQDVLFQPKTKMLISGIGNYRLIREERYSGISGWSWFSYRRENGKQDSE